VFALFRRDLRSHQLVNAVCFSGFAYIEHCITRWYTQLLPRSIDALEGLDVVQIAAGWTSTAALTGWLLYEHGSRFIVCVAGR